MFPKRTCPARGYRLGAILLSASLAACSSMGSGDDSGVAPVPRTAGSADANSLEPDRGASTGAVDTTYEPKLVPIDGSQVPLAEDSPDRYVVKPGDTLWDIASVFLKDPWYWPEIWHVNPEIENPHLIYPGDVLALVWIDGQPRITAVQGSAYRMSPQARITPLEQAARSIPYEQISSFLSKGLVLEKEQIDGLPYILATRDQHLIAAAGIALIAIPLALGEFPIDRNGPAHIGIVISIFRADIHQ